MRAGVGFTPPLLFVQTNLSKPTNMNLRIASAITGLIALSGVSQAATLIVPAFGNTSSQYNGILRAARQQPLIAVINPDNGVGSGRIGSVGSFVNRVQGTGSLAVGYINTNYGSRSISSVKSDINAYVSRYGADGIFLDEFSDSLGDLSFYREIYKYAKSKGLKVVGNPGTFVPKQFAGVTDILITWEDFYSNGFSSWKQKGWTKKYSKKKFGAMVQGTSNYQSAISRANSQNAEFVYVTDTSYGSLPGNFNSQASHVAGLGGVNVQAIPEPTVTFSLAAAAGMLALRRRRR